MKQYKLSLLFLSLYFIFPACSPNLEDRVKIYEEAHNNHDIEKVMSLYTNDITFEIVGSWVKNGKEQVRGLAEWDATTNSLMIISDIEVRKDTVEFRLKEGNDWFRLIGIEFMYYYPCRIIFRDGLIKKIEAEVTSESNKLFRELWPPVYNWLSQERNNELSELISGGEFVYNLENATKWISILKEWREGSKK
jgi:hypothetical protein